MKKKRWMKRIASAVLTAAMVVSQIGVWNAGWGQEVVKAEEAIYNYITNGGFENDSIEPWIVAGENVTSQVATWAAQNGSKGLELNYPWEDGRTSQTTRLTQTIASIPAGEYELSISMAGTSDATESFFIIAGGVKETSSITNKSEAWDDYRTYKAIISIDEEQTNYVIGIEMDLKSSDKKVILDDVSLTKVIEDTSEPIIKNGDFENGISNWTIEGLIENTNYCIKKSDGHSSQDLEIWKPSSDLTFSVSQNVAIPAGTYTLSVDSAGNVDNTVVRVGDLVSLNLKWSAFSATSDAVTRTSDKFVVSEETITTVSIEGTLKSGWGGMYFDNIVLNKIEVADKSKLQALVNKVPTDLSDFGTSSETALSQKLEAAKTCLKNDEATSEEVNNCYNELETALNALVYEDNTINVTKIDGLNDKTDFIKGIDISSYVTEINSGVKYYDWFGKEITTGKDFIKLFAETGVNYIRIRVWNDPKDANGNYYGGGNNDLEMAKKICGYIKEYNDAYKDTLGEVKVLVDLQYSDFWADPEKQAAPKAWKDMTIDDRVSKVKEFTNTCLSEIAQTGVTIGMVQIGNETNTGICGTEIPSLEEKDFSKEVLENTDYVRIFDAGCDAVDQYNGTNGTNIKKVVHFTDPHSAKTFYAKLLKIGGVNYDVYATSYYPFWHGTTDNLKTMLSNIASECGVEVMVAETQYVYTNKDYDGADNQAYEGKNNIDLSQWPVSVQGQANEIRDVMNAAANATNGIGMFYWEPAWLGVGNVYNEDGTLDETKLSENKAKWETYGSGWATEAAREYDPSAAKWGGGGTNNENASLFDFTGHPLASLNVFKYVNYGAKVTSPSYYAYDKDKMNNITVAVGDTKESILSVLNASNPSIGYINNDNTSGTANIVWDTDSAANIENQIKTTTAVGNAFIATGKIEVNGQLHNVTCSVFVKPDKNYVENGDFENTGSTDGWTYVNGDMIFIKANNTRNNSKNALAFESGAQYIKNLTPDNNGCYTGKAYQNITLEAGIYEAKAFFEGGDGIGKNKGEQICIFVQNGESTVSSNYVTLNGWMDWQCASISNIVITNDMVKNNKNVITLGISVCMQKDGWGSADDCYLYKVGEYIEKPSGGNGGGGSGSTPTTPSTPNNTKPDNSTETKPDSNTETKPDGTTVETKTETKEDGTKVETTTETATDGSKKETVVETKPDGTKVETITETAVDGSKVETKKETEQNSAGKQVDVATVTKTDADGKVTSVVEKSTINEVAENTKATVTVKKNGEGAVTSATASVATTIVGQKTTLSADVVSQLKEAAGQSDVRVSLTAKNEEGKTLYTVKVEVKNLTAENELYIYKLDKKTGELVMVNSKTYKVDENGGLDISIKNKATYELVSKEEAKAIEKQIKATVKVQNSSKDVKKGKTTKVAFDKKMNMNNVKDITYSTADKKIATVSKSGKVTAKAKGTVKVKATVILKNGSKKTVIMKIKVK